jgi:hypothetical protein
MAQGECRGAWYPCYLAEHDAQPGRNLAKKVMDAIDASEAVVVLLSSNSVEAPYVHQEIGWALKGNFAGWVG